MSEELTRSDVMQMIETAIAALRGRGDFARGNVPSGSKEPSIGLDERGNRVITTTFKEGAIPPPPKQKSVIKLDERGDPFVSTTKINPQATLAQKPVEMGYGQRQIPDPIGGHRAADISDGLGGATGSRATGGRSKEAIADQIEETEEKFKEKVQADLKITDDADAKFRETIGNDITARVLSVADREYISRTEVIDLINDAIPSTLRHVGRAATSQATGNYLKLENGAQTAVWGSGEVNESGITYDYCYVGATKVTIPTKTTNFLKITFGPSPSATWVGAMPETQDSNSVVLDVTKNRVYIHGAFAG